MKGSKVGGAALGWSCFGASDHGPVSSSRVGQSVDLPVKARRWGHDLRGSPQSGCLKPWSRPPQPRCTPSLRSVGRQLLSRGLVDRARAGRRQERRPGEPGRTRGAEQAALKKTSRESCNSIGAWGLQGLKSRVRVRGSRKPNPLAAVRRGRGYLKSGSTPTTEHYGNGNLLASVQLGQLAPLNPGLKRAVLSVLALLQGQFGQHHGEDR